jgi:hypothetical protein
MYHLSIKARMKGKKTSVCFLVVIGPVSDLEMAQTSEILSSARKDFESLISLCITGVSGPAFPIKRRSEADAGKAYSGTTGAYVGLVNKLEELLIGRAADRSPQRWFAEELAVIVDNAHRSRALHESNIARLTGEDKKPFADEEDCRVVGVFVKDLPAKEIRPPQLSAMDILTIAASVRSPVTPTTHATDKDVVPGEKVHQPPNQALLDLNCDLTNFGGIDAGDDDHDYDDDYNMDHINPDSFSDF